jgi:hypothetical protein
MRAHLILLIVLCAAFVATPVSSSTPVPVEANTENGHICAKVPGEFTPLAPIILGEPSMDREVAKRHSLQVIRSNGQARYVTFLAGSQVTAFEATLATDSTKGQIDNELTKLARQKLEQLEDRFGIYISRDGLMQYAAKSAGNANPRFVPFRQPKLGEVLALEYALERSLPEFCSRNQLQILYSPDPLYGNRIAQWELSSKERSTIIVGKNSGSWMLDYVLMHELAHHSQFKMGLQKGSAICARQCKELGWSTFSNPQTGMTGWMINTKGDPSYKYSENLQCWVRCNTSGQPLNAEGQRVKRQVEAQQLTDKDIRRIAAVRPCTSYMSNPLEVQAEGLAMYRLGAEQRSQLKAVSPELFELVEDFDKRFIRKDFGVQMVRSADGRIISTEEIASRNSNSTI